MNKVGVFSDWIYEFDVSAEVIQQAVSLVEGLDYERDGHQIVLSEGYPSDFLRHEFNRCLEEVRKDLGLHCKRLESSLFWVNRSLKGDWHHAHRHANSWASGILYLTPSGSHTWFSRETIWSDKGDLEIYDSPEEAKRVVATYPTTPGKVVIFPSKVIHSVDEHDLETPRYTLSFNSWPRGVIGDLPGLTRLDLG